LADQYDAADLFRRSHIHYEVIMNSRSWLFAVVIVGTFALQGCGGYKLQGKVLRGEESKVELVHVMDPRMKQTGLSNVEVLVRRDPKSMNPSLAGKDRTNASGDFSMGIDEFGAGWMEEQWQIRSGLHGYQNAEAVMKLPKKGGKTRLLITLAPGTAVPLNEPDEIIQDIERFK
jgi:hypothetical protein